MTLARPDLTESRARALFVLGHRMSGRRHSQTDQDHINGIVENAIALGADHPRIMPYPMLMPTIKADAVSPVEDAPMIYGAVKAAGDNALDVLYLPYGGPHDGKDAHGEYFSPATKEHADKFPSPLIIYYHGYTPDGEPQGEPDVIGQSVKRWADSAGRWMRVQLDATKELARKMLDAAKSGTARASSGSIAHLVRKERDGHITNWPVVEVSLIDAQGRRQPANAYAVAMPAAKARYQSAGVDFPEVSDTEPETEATGANSAAVLEASVKTTPPISSPRGDFDMDEKDLMALLDRRDAERKAQAEVEAARKAAEEERVNAAVKAALELQEQQAAKTRRLPVGETTQAPAQARFAHTRKYDNLNAADTALVASMLKSAQRPVPSALAQSILIKVAEDKQSNVEVRAARNDAAKAIGIEPSDALNAMKANELDYSTQSGFGDEFVPTVWSTAIWEQVRFGEDLVSQIPQQMFSGPGDTFTIPIEGADMTWYRVGQATDLNATTGRPDATIGDSKLATANGSMSFGAGQKMATRVPYTGELVEDSIVPWASQVNKQLAVSFLEMLQHVAIDGDTATGATTNINHIGGTPTSTGTKQDLFLLVNGFRKSALVTTTANSLSAAGSLTDTNFLQIAQLLGPAGLYSDPTKCAFLLDANVYWKVLQLASVKTRDVFTNATIERGRIDNIWGFPVYRAPFMHFRSTTNPRKANTAGKVDLTTQGNNTTGSAVLVRWDQWLLGYKRNLTLATQSIPDSDAYQIVATARVNLLQRDTEGSAVLYNIGV